MPDPVIPHHPDVALYALGALEDDERARVQEHLDVDACEVCRAEVDDLQGPAALLLQGEPPVEVPADLEPRTLARVRRVASRRRLRRRLVAAATGSSSPWPPLAVARVGPPPGSTRLKVAWPST
jgi:anti-sigma factor RsiW